MLTTPSPNASMVSKIQVNSFFSCTNVFVICNSMFLLVLTCTPAQQHLLLAGLEQSGLMFDANQSDDFQLLFAICMSFTMYCNYHKCGSQVSAYMYSPVS